MKDAPPEPGSADDSNGELEEFERAIGPRWAKRRVLGVVLVLGGGAAALSWATRSPQSLPWDAVTSGPMNTETRVVEEGKIEAFLERNADDASAMGSGQRHAGEEGRMGRPTSKNKSGLYAMKGPKDPIPSMGLGLAGTGRGGGGTGTGDRIGVGQETLEADDEEMHARSDGARGTFATTDEQPVTTTTSDATSTFSVDVDTASYSRVRDSLARGVLPPVAAVRIEELVNYFDYDYEPPTDRSVPFSVNAEVGPSPWGAGKTLVTLGLEGWVPTGPVPARNLVFLVDVSGSMNNAEKLPLLVRSLSRVIDQLRAEDHVALVVYAGASGVVLEPTSGKHKREIREALTRLRAGGSTNGGAGIELAYRLAERHFVEGGINRVVLATDGDFNVGVSDTESLETLIASKRESGVFLSVLGFGSGNDATMETLADKGNGNYAFIDSDREARKVLVDELSSTLVTIAKDVKIQVALDPDKVESWRLVGYDNRRLAHRDFDDDSKDAGEIGAGHTVTAIYEITPKPGVKAGDALMTVALRYKRPDGEESQRLEIAVAHRDVALADTSEDFRFAAAVAETGLLLRQSKHAGTATWRQALELAEGAIGRDESCLRAEFIDLVRQASHAAGETVPSGEPSGRCSS